MKTEYSTTVSYLRVVRLCPDRVQQLIEVGVRNVLTCESEFSCLVVHQRCSSTGSITGSITGTSHVQLLDESVVGSRIRLSSNDAAALKMAVLCGCCSQVRTGLTHSGIQQYNWQDPSASRPIRFLLL